MKRKYILVGLIFVLAILSFVPHTSAQNATCGEHVVARGENLFRIAQTYGSTVEAMAAANNIANPSQIFAGQRLVIPCAGAPISQGLPAVWSINATTAEYAEPLLIQEWASRPIDVATSLGNSPHGAMALLEEAGKVWQYSLDAPDTPVGVIGGDDARFVYRMAVSWIDNALAVAEYDEAASGGTVVTIYGSPGSLDEPLEITIPLEQGISLTEMALDGDLLGRPYNCSTTAARGSAGPPPARPASGRSAAASPCRTL
ncbi:MAG: LysM domain-containing protein [Acidobacteriales bacterium]|nr:LysM domain-containing protein [Terriglobales bacterium]